MTDDEVELDRLIYLNLERKGVGQFGVSGNGVFVVNRAPATDEEAVAMLRKLARSWAVDMRKILDANPDDDENWRDYKIIP